jgi:GDP-L-fucose synthase
VRRALTQRTEVAVEKQSRIYVAGHTGLVGSALVRRLQNDGYENLLLVRHESLDLTDRDAVFDYFSSTRPEYVFLAAARVGGIGANSADPVGFLLQNVRISFNVIEAAFQLGVTKLLNLGSSCIYPRNCSQPMQPQDLLTGALEETNKSYALAKLAAVQACWSYRTQYGADFVTALPTNLYGPGDLYHPEHSHVVPSLIFKIAVSLKSGFQPVLWGSGRPLRELLHVDDLADALVLIMQNYNSDVPINVGSGQEHSISEIYTTIAELMGYDGPVCWDASKPDGTPRKLLDSSVLFEELGWAPKISLREGLAQTIEVYRRGSR